MNLRDLEYVVAVADHGHFGRAAAACNVSQPTLSGQILKLEAELGLRLFDREGRGARVSDRAATVVAQARATLAAAAGVSAAADAARDPFAGELRLGIITTVAPYLLPIALPGLAEALPHDASLSGRGSDRPASCALARRRPRRRGHRDRPARRQAGVDRALRRTFLPRLFRPYEKARARLDRRRGDRSGHPSAAGRGSLPARSGLGALQCGGEDGAGRGRPGDEPRDIASSRFGRTGGDARAPPRLCRLAAFGRRDRRLEDCWRRRIAAGEARLQARLAAGSRARGACRRRCGRRPAAVLAKCLRETEAI